MSRYVAILAGGSGTRLWPLSRSHRPKQLLSLIGERSLVQATVDRVAPLVPHERILVVTEASHADDLRGQLPEIPAENILVEPVRRGTAAAVGLAAVAIGHRDPDATMASLHSDHAVRDADAFRRSLAAEFELAESGEWLVTLGIRPSSPHTGLGYVQVGSPIGSFEGVTGYKVVRFVEKPNRDSAERFVSEGYLWNAGMFAWRVEVVLKEFERFLPEIHARLVKVGEVLGITGESRVLEERYAEIPAQTIDYGIMERAERVAVIPADFGWSDLANWAELLQIAIKDTHGNVVRGDHVGADTRRTLVYGSDRPIFTLGVEDLVIVDTPEALLVCHREQAERVKQLVEELQRDPKRRELL